MERTMPKNAIEAATIVCNSMFEPMDDNDRACFAGASKDALICNSYGNQKIETAFLIVCEGSEYEFIPNEGEVVRYHIDIFQVSI